MGRVGITDAGATAPAEVGELRLFVDGDQTFTELSARQQIAAVRAQHSLNVMDMRGHLDLRRCKRMFEFGAGSGGSSFVLARLALLNGGTVEVIEIMPAGAEEIVQSGILPPENVHTGDGISRLINLERVGKKFDLIAAFMFGPDYHGEHIERFLPAAYDALDIKGKLLISSDNQTMEAVRLACANRRIEVGDYYPPLTRTYDLDQPDKMDTIVVPKANMPADL